MKLKRASNPLLSSTLLALLVSAPALAAKPETLWKSWYVYSINGKASGFYEETAERRTEEKQIAVNQKWVEREGTLSETYIGSISTDDGKFTPVAFFCERKQSGKESVVDGRAKDSAMQITIKPAGGGKEKRSAILKPGIILSNALPLMLAGKKASKDPMAFQAIVEDVRDGNYEPREGAALVSDATKKIGGLNCRKVTVDFQGALEWWVAPNGQVCEITNQANGTRIALSTEKEAKKALGIK